MLIHIKRNFCITIVVLSETGHKQLAIKRSTFYLSMYPVNFRGPCENRIRALNKAISRI